MYKTTEELLVILSNLLKVSENECVEFKRANLDINAIILLDRLQKRYTISKQQSDYLKKEHLIEGRYPNIYISSSLASLTEKKEEYVYNSGLENEFYMELIIKYIKEYCSASRKEIISLLKDKLPNSLDEIGKINRVRYLLNILKKQGKIYNEPGAGGVMLESEVAVLQLFCSFLQLFCCF